MVRHRPPSPGNCMASWRRVTCAGVAHGKTTAWPDRKGKERELWRLGAGTFVRDIAVLLRIVALKIGISISIPLYRALEKYLTVIATGLSARFVSDHLVPTRFLSDHLVSTKFLSDHLVSTRFLVAIWCLRDLWETIWRAEIVCLVWASRIDSQTSLIPTPLLPFGPRVSVGNTKNWMESWCFVIVFVWEELVLFFIPIFPTTGRIFPGISFWYFFFFNSILF